MTTSIALATYNGARWLPEQLASLTAQTMLPDELVVSDDASMDDTVSIVRAFAETAPFPVVVIENDDNVGFGRNFERALSKCSSDLVFLADQDDIWLPHKLETVAKRMADGAPLALHNAVCVDEHNIQHGPDLFERLRMLRQNPSWTAKGCCTAVTSGVLRLALPLPQWQAHDVWLHRIARAVGQPVYIDEPLIRYRLHPEHISQTRLNQLEATKLRWYEPISYRLRKLLRPPSTAALRDRAAELQRLTIVAEDSGNEASLMRYRDEAASIQARLARRDALRRLHLAS